jgi:hypothetical protein
MGVTPLERRPLLSLRLAQTTVRMQSLGLEILQMQRGDEAMPERIIRERMGNNPDTSKALRR